jgi:hypothetical protein
MWYSPNCRKGVRPSDIVREELPNPEWDMKLKPSTDEPMTLKGVHTFSVALEVYSVAEEIYKQVDVL